MKRVLLLVLVVASVCFAGTGARSNLQDITMDPQVFFTEAGYLKNNMTLIAQVRPGYCRKQTVPLNEIKKLLYRYSDGLDPAVIDAVLTIVRCAGERGIRDNRYLTIIDYSIPSSKKQLWIFDLAKLKLLFNTYVSHGINSGTLNVDYFSNNVNSRASSMGVFTTETAYHGRHGLSLKLMGLDRNINDRAYQRNIVMHAAWYVEEDFVKKYGRSGRSWGCPAVPKNLIKPIVDTIQSQSLLIVYYPSFSWITKSKYLNCDNISVMPNRDDVTFMPHVAAEDHRGEILFIDRNNNGIFEEGEPIPVMSADNYRHAFNASPPLERMLRRQINHIEYIALNRTDLSWLDSNGDQTITEDDIYGLKDLEFVVSVVITRGHAYIGTEFKFIQPGTISRIDLNTSPSLIVHLPNRTEILRSTDRFIRWLGL